MSAREPDVESNPDPEETPVEATAESMEPAPELTPPRRKMGLGQKLIVGVLLTVVLAPPTAGFYSYFSGVPLHLLASAKGKEEGREAAETPTSASVALVSGRVHTVAVPDEVCGSLGIHTGDRDAIGVALPPSHMRPLVLPGSTALDPNRLARIRARFAPARVVKLAQVEDPTRAGGRTEFRELRQGDHVTKGDLLGVFYSPDVASRKNDLLDALVQLDLDQKILDEADKHAEAVPQVFLLTETRAVQGDRNAINRALTNLRLWDIPQDEIDALHAEAKKICADKNAWIKTPEGRWASRAKQPAAGANGAAQEQENPWGRVTLRAPFDGVVVERNVTVGDLVVDNTVNLFQIADVSRLLVVASCPEDELPILESLTHNQKRWAIRTVGQNSATGLSGAIEEIGYVIDPNQHTAVVKGYVENPGKHIRGGQYVTATVEIPPPAGVVEIPADALVDDGLQSLVFVQPDPEAHVFSMRRVHVVQRFEHTVFVQATPIPPEERLTARESEQSLLPKEALLPGERVLLAGAVELKAVVMDLESRPGPKPAPDRPLKSRHRAAFDLESPRAVPSTRKG